MIIGNNANAGTVYFNTAFDTKSYDKNIRNTLSSTENAFSKTFGKIGKTIALALSVTAISKFTKSCIDLGSDLAEVQNVVDVVFPNINSQVNNFAKNAINQFGLSELATKKYMGTFGAMSKSFGFSEQAAFEMSKTVTGLVGDVSSFYNISQELAYTKLKSVWTGETETLKDLGIVMTQTALNEYALRNGFSKTIDKMTEAEKVSLRYSFVQNQLASATGDFARTSDGWANQVRVLSLRFDQLKASLGQGFINLFTPIVKCLNIVISKLQVVADGFSKFTSLLFGKQQQVISNTASQYNDLGASAIQSADDIASASKKVQKAVMGYDKLNILTNTKNSSSSGGGGSSSGIGISTPTVSTPTVDDTISPQMQKIVDKIMSYIEPLKKISFDNLINSFHNLRDSLGFLADGTLGLLESFYFNLLVPMATYTIEDFLPHFFNSTAKAIKNIDFPKIQDSLETLWESLVPFRKNIGEGLLWFYDKVLLPVAGWTINDVIPTFLSLLSSALDILNSAIKDIKPLWDWFWENALSPIAKWTGGIIVKVLNSIGDALNWISKNEVAMALLEGLAITIGIISGAIAIYNGVMIVCNTVTGIFAGIMAVLTSPITLVIGVISLLVAGILLLIKHWDDVSAAAGACWNWIVSVWNGACEWFNSTIIQPLGSFFSGMWDGLTNGASQAWEGIKSVFASVASFFGNIFGNAWQTVKNVFSTGGKIFDGIKDGIVNAFKTIVNTIIKGINKVVSIPFDGINSALKRIKGINIMGAKPFNWMPTIKVPQIPQLAEGAWFKARNPQLVMVGEGKSNEIVAPEPKLDDAIERGFKKYGNGGSGGKLEITIIHKYPDGRMMIDEINETQVKEGKILLNT